MIAVSIHPQMQLKVKVRIPEELETKTMTQTPTAFKISPLAALSETVLSPQLSETYQKKHPFLSNLLDQHLSCFGHTTHFPYRKLPSKKKKEREKKVYARKRKIYIKCLSAYPNVVLIPTLCKTSNDEGAHFHLASRD